jgi:hypothetical protein
MAASASNLQSLLEDIAETLLASLRQREDRAWQLFCAQRAFRPREDWNVSGGVLRWKSSARQGEGIRRAVFLVVAHSWYELRQGPAEAGGEVFFQKSVLHPCAACLPQA